MSTFAHWYVSRWLLTAVLVSLPAINLRAETASPSGKQKELQTIEAAWTARTDKIHSLTMRIDAEEFTKGRGDKPLDNDKNNPFREPLPEAGRTFKISLDYAFKQGKAALTRSGPVINPDDPEKTSHQTLQFSFDGHECRSLGGQAGFPLGGTFEKRDSPDGPIIQNADLLAVHFWMQPNIALHAFWGEKVTKTVEEKLVDVDGVSCRRIRIASSKGPRIVTLDLDPQRAWLPLQWQVTYEKPQRRLSASLTIKYGDDVRVGPVPMVWTLTDFDPDGGVKKIRKAKVTACQINGNIDDNRFTLAFPVGTRVSERTSDDKTRQYIQKETGLEPIDKGK